MTGALIASCGGDDSTANPTSPEGGPLPDGSVVLPDGYVVPPQGDGAVGSCLGSDLLASLGKTRLLSGGSMEDPTAAAAPIDVRYIYISGQFPDGAICKSCATNCTTGGKTCANSGGGCGWWGCWQYDQNPPGDYVRGYIDKVKKAGQIPFFSYYMILQSSGVQEGAPEVTKTADAKYMNLYFDEYRFFLQQIGTNVAMIHLEPDFWGYGEQLKADPHQIPSAIKAANATDCAAMEDSLAGLGACMIAMTRKYAPNAKVGLHASAWGSNVDVSMNTDPKFDVAGEAAKVAAFLKEAGEKDADFVVVEASDRDAGYYQSINRKAWWDDTNATLPNYHQHLAWVKALTEALGKPAIHWQLPLGNMSQNNTSTHWKDNRVDYYFAHMNEVAAAHSLGVLFGSGATGQTTPETDGGNFISKVKAYSSAGGQKLCP
jgi:hypothetical protein